MKYTHIPTNFIYPKVTPRHYRFGSSDIVGVVLREDGDWRDYLPPFERQNVNRIESSACYIEAQQHCIATIQEEKYGMIDQNYSARFNSIRSNGTETGGDPLEGADSLRHDGMIPDSMLPFSDLIQSWNDYHSFKGGDESECNAIASEFAKKWNLSYDIVFEYNDSIESKYKKLRGALKLSPVPMSVLGWYQNNTGLYIKPEGGVDNHLTLCVYLDADNCPWVMDTYEPFLKKLEPFYNSDFAMRWSVTKKEPSKRFSFKDWWRTFINNLKIYVK